MAIDLEYIKQLVRYDLSGTIEPEEKAYLDNAVATNADAKRIYDTLKSEFTGEKLEEVSNELTGRFLTENPAFNTKKSNKRPIIIISITALAAAIIGFLIFVNVPRYDHKAPTGTIPIAMAKGVELKLGSGQTFDLSQQTGTINSGDAVLKNSNKHLSVVNSTDVVQIATLNVPYGMDYKVQLSDGTSVHLNAGSSLTFPLSFPSGTREVTIAGEAFVTVKTDETKPFLVRFNKGAVQVLGTEFNINTYDSQVDKIALVSGRLKVISSNDSLVLKPGFEASITAQDHLQVAEFDSYDVLSWRKGEYPFSNATLAELAQLLERYYGIKVKVDTSTLYHNFTGVISRKTPIEDFLNGLKLTGFVKEYKFDEEGTLHVRN